jgi:transmembrane sensor
LRLSEPVGKATKGSECVTMQMDRPHVDQLMAWRRNGAVFDDVPLSDAVTEIDGYSRQSVVLVGDESSKGLRISGLFRTDDNVAFAHAMAALHACTGWLCTIVKITWSLRRVAEVEEIGE